MKILFYNALYNLNIHTLTFHFIIIKMEIIHPTNTFELEIPDLVRWYSKTSDEGLRITNDSIKNALFYCAEDDLENTKQQLIHIGLVAQKLSLIMGYINDYHNKNIINKEIVDYFSANFEKVINNSKICMQLINRCSENINNLNM